MAIYISPGSIVLESIDIPLTEASPDAFAFMPFAISDNNNAFIF